jgi:hypothetical protein
MGQLSNIIRSKYLVDAKGLNLLRGIPFQIVDLKISIDQILEKKTDE